MYEQDLPRRLWAEVKREEKPNFRTLAKAQAALGIAILSYMPLRPENLTELAFGTNLFIREEPGAISSLERSAGEVKNQETEVAFDIPQQIVKMLIEYRNRIAPAVIGRRPERVFVNADGTGRVRPRLPGSSRPISLAVQELGSHPTSSVM
jgi:hypothetical protein